MILLDRLRVENFKSLRRIDLQLPRHGSVLIEGLNEAGKSTLFESVYFALYGKPLDCNVDECLRYGAETALVTLSLEVDGTRLEVQRTLRRNRANAASLVVQRPGAQPETIQAVRAVNARIVDELGKLDGDALLNSCFVEQKKLSKLEDMGAEKRKDSLLRLLNLEKLSDMESTFKVTRADEQTLTHAAQRRELAEVQQRLPALERERSAVERLLRALDLLRDLEKLAALRQSLVELRTEVEKLHAMRQDVDARLHLAERLRQAAAAAQRIVARYQALAPEERQRDQLRLAIAELNRKEQEDLPFQEQRYREMQDLVGELEGIARDRLRLEELSARLQALATLEETRAGLRAEQERLESDYRQRAEEGCQIEAVLTQLDEEQQTHLPQLEETRQVIEGLSRRLDAFLTRQTETQRDLAAEAQNQERLRSAITLLDRKEAEDLPIAGRRHQELLALIQELEGWEAQQRQHAEIVTRRRELAALGDARNRLRAERARLAADRAQRDTEARQYAVALEQLADEERTLLPKLEADRQALETLIGRLEALQAGRRQRVESEREVERLTERLNEGRRLEQRVTALKTECETAESALASTRTAMADLQHLDRQFQIADALREWLRLRRSADALAIETAAVERQEATASELRREYERIQRACGSARVRLMLLGALGGVVALGAVGAALSRFQLLALPLALLALLLGFLAWQARARTARLAVEAGAAQAEAARQEQLTSRQRAEREAAQRLGGGMEDLARYEHALTSLGQVVPVSSESGEALIADLDARLAGKVRADVLTAERESRQTLIQLEAAQGSRQASLEDLRRQATAYDVAGLEQTVTAKKAELVELTAEIDAEQGAIGQDLQARGWTEDVARLRSAREDVLRDLATVHARLDKRGETESQLANVRGQVAIWSTRLAAIDDELARHDDVCLAAEASALLAQEQTLEAEIALQQEKLSAQAGQQAIPLQSGAARELAGRVGSELKALQQQIAGRAALTAEFAASQDRANARRVQLAAEESQLQKPLAARRLSFDPQQVRQALADANGELVALRQRLARRPELAGQLADLQAQMGTWQRRLAAIAAELGRYRDTDLVTEAQAYRQERTELGGTLDRRRGALAPVLAQYEVAEDVGAARELAGRAASELAALRREIEGRPAMVMSLNQCDSAIAEHYRQIASEAGALAAQTPEDMTVPAGGGAVMYQAFVDDATRRREALDEPRLRQELARLDGELGRAHEREQAAVEQQAQIQIRSRAALDFLDAAPDCALDLISVERACPVVRGAANRSEPELKMCSEELLGESAALRHRRVELERFLDVVGVDLNLEECREDERRQAQAIEVKRRAVRIVTGVRLQMVAKVLPNTERNLRFLLPLLTADRYHDARITEDYRIEVWDQTANSYVAKSIFSGGTRDQFSLALRLAFALATLPQELGTTPGFVFLDEPLSSFDSQRARALVDLLTRGHIAANFMQIFVIAHTRSFDPAAFPYHLRLEGGQVVESDLPHPGPTGVEL